MIAREFRPEKYSGIILVGGDGTIHETLNGLALHEHPEIALRTPLGIIPAGSGNSLASSLNLSVENAAEKIFRQKTRHVDLFRVVVNPTTIVFGFCVVSWGLHARIVCDSEKFRVFGNRRFVWSAIWNVLFRKHMAHLFLEDAKEAEEPEKLDQSEKSEKLDQSEKSEKLNQSEKLGTFQLECPVGYLVVTKVRELEKGFPITPYACLDDGFVDLMLVPTCSRRKVGTFLGSVYSGAHLKLPYLNYCKSRRVKLTPRTNSSPLCVDGEMYRVEVGKPVLIETNEKWRAVVYS